MRTADGGAAHARRLGHAKYCPPVPCRGEPVRRGTVEFTAASRFAPIHKASG
ncbi:hypothetical protein BSIN_0777 [Burkholderia singularis]|uniref:Uncharacterized protein n=1 Tax=Burkholderia singularis TaxID=1503053 RepID=A0A238HA34_9BURK|nr:hypothetical protein BSIN_0777 [Burkholderia singularis]